MTAHTCLTSALPSLTAWIRTCLNPDDQKAYLIAYHGCFGKHDAEPGTDCECNATDRALPIYRPQADPDVVWCFGQPSFIYHGSVAILVGLAS
jgi:methylamine dehydrogenase light chain